MAGTELRACRSTIATIPPGMTASQNGPASARRRFTLHKRHSWFSASRILAGVEQVPQVGQVASGGIGICWYQFPVTASRTLSGGVRFLLVLTLCKIHLPNDPGEGGGPAAHAPS